MKTIKVMELEVHVGAMPEVVDILIANEMDNSLTGTDDDYDLIFLEVSYDKDDDNQKAAIHEIEDIIADYEDDDEDEDENKKGQTAGNSNLSSLVVPTGIEPVSKV